MRRIKYFKSLLLQRSDIIITFRLFLVFVKWTSYEVLFFPNVSQEKELVDCRKPFLENSSSKLLDHIVKLHVAGKSLAGGNGR